MRNCTKILLLALALSLCLGLTCAAGTALAEGEAPAIDAVLYARGGNGNTIINAILPEQEGEGDWYYDTWGGNLHFNNYDEMRDWYGGVPSWSLISDGGLDMEVFPQWGDDGRENEWCDIRIYGAPSQAGTYPAVIGCDWGGQHAEFPLTVRYIKTADVPTGCNIPPVIVLKAGQTTEFVWDFNDGYSFTGELWYPMNLNYEFTTFDDLFEERFEGNHVFITPKQNEADYWFGAIKIVDGNVGCHREVLFRIEDDEHEEFDHDGMRWPIRFEDDYVNGAEINFAIFDDTDNIFHDSWVFDFRMNDYGRLSAVLGQMDWWEPEILEGREDVRFHLERRDERDVYLWIDETPQEEGYTVFRVGGGWNDGWYTCQDFRVNWVRADGLPEGTNIGETLELTAGEEKTFYFFYQPDVSFQSRNRINWNLRDDNMDNHGIWWEHNGFDLTIHADEPGVYPAWIDLIRGNIAVRSYTVLRVADENGNVPEPELAFEDESCYAYETDRAIFQDNGETGLYHDGWVRNYIIANF